MEINKLLFVTKFNDLSFNALQSILTLQHNALHHVVFVHVIERDKIVMHRGIGYQKSEEVRLREAANIRFIDWAETLFEQGMEVGVYIVVGNLISRIIEAAQKEKPDLIVIGRSHKRFIDQLYSGSDVIQLIRRTAVPVLVYTPPRDKIERLDKPFERPLLATDWSQAGNKAVEFLLSLKGIAKEVSVVHVADEKDLKGTSSMAVQKVRKDTRAGLETIVERLEAKQIKARAHVYIGDPIEEIEKAAKECQASMIVLGSSSKPAWQERWLGSITRAIAEKSDCPTLVVPPPESV